MKAKSLAGARLRLKQRINRVTKEVGKLYVRKAELHKTLAMKETLLVELMRTQQNLQPVKNDLQTKQATI